MLLEPFSPGRDSFASSLLYSLPVCLMPVHLFRVVLDVIALELDKLIETEFTQSLTSARVFPANPCQVLMLSVLLRI